MLASLILFYTILLFILHLNFINYLEISVVTIIIYIIYYLNIVFPYYTIMATRELVDLLSDSYVSYELDIRQFNYERLTLGGKKVALVDILNDEDSDADNQPRLVSQLTPIQDLQECKSLFDELREMFIQDRVWNATVIDACLKFLYPRVRRINTVVGEEINYRRSFLLNELTGLRADISRISVPLPGSHSYSFENLDRRRDLIPVPPSCTTPPSTHNQNYVPVWKWDIKFSGDEAEISAAEFLQTINDYSRSRNVNENELLNSVSDLLTGSARKWFRSASFNNSFQTWNDFSIRFLEDFEPGYETEKLLDDIKRRFQQSDEGVTKFIICMEDLFLRLPYRLEETKRVAIIYKNLLPCYIKGLAMWKFCTVNDLKVACKNLESAEVTIKSRSDYQPLNPSNFRNNFAQNKNTSYQYRPTQNFQPNCPPYNVQQPVNQYQKPFNMQNQPPPINRPRQTLTQQPAVNFNNGQVQRYHNQQFNQRSQNFKNQNPINTSNNYQYHQYPRVNSMKLNYSDQNYNTESDLLAAPSQFQDTNVNYENDYDELELDDQQIIPENFYGTAEQGSATVQGNENPQNC